MLNIDLTVMDRPLDLHAIARLGGLTHAFITTRILRDTSTPLASDVVFIEAARAHMEAIRAGEDLGVEDIESQVAKTAGKSRDPLAALLSAAHLSGFAKSSAAVVAAFRKADWATFGEASQECVAYLFQDFPEPTLCAHFCAVRLAAPIGLTGRTLVREWNTFGVCCHRAGLEEGAALARRKLGEFGQATLADSW
jgi:hypothetical protein